MSEAFTRKPNKKPCNGIAYYREKLKVDGTGKANSQQALCDFLYDNRPEGADPIPRSRISMIETGDIIPKPWELERMSEYLGITPGHLYTVTKIKLIYELAREEGEV
jgi:hypothetical protein